MISPEILLGSPKKERPTGGGRDPEGKRQREVDERRDGKLPSHRGRSDHGRGDKEREKKRRRKRIVKP